MHGSLICMCLHEILTFGELQKFPERSPCKAGKIKIIYQKSKKMKNSLSFVTNYALDKVFY